MNLMNAIWNKSKILQGESLSPFCLQSDTCEHYINISCGVFHAQLSIYIDLCQNVIQRWEHWVQSPTLDTAVNVENLYFIDYNWHVLLIVYVLYLHVQFVCG